MIGAKKLATIRQELQRALSATGDDPIHWLEERMNAPSAKGLPHPARARFCTPCGVYSKRRGSKGGQSNGFARKSKADSPEAS
jgi:hypothetical protein